MHSLWRLLLPELRQFPANEQSRALEKARATDLDVVELIGVAFGLVLVTAITRYTLPDDATSSRFAAAMLNFVVAVPLIGIAVAPFHIRRLRRGLRSQLQPGERR